MGAVEQGGELSTPLAPSAQIPHTAPLLQGATAHLASDTIRLHFCIAVGLCVAREDLRVVVPALAVEIGSAELAAY